MVLNSDEIVEFFDTGRLFGAYPALDTKAPEILEFGHILAEYEKAVKSFYNTLRKHTEKCRWLKPIERREKNDTGHTHYDEKLSNMSDEEFQEFKMKTYDDIYYTRMEAESALDELRTYYSEIQMRIDRADKSSTQCEHSNDYFRFVSDLWFDLELRYPYCGNLTLENV